MFMITFDYLPIAAVVTNDNGRYFCCHGGLADTIRTTDDIEYINRFQEPMSGGLLDILWADPNDKHPDIEYSTNNIRQCSSLFGYKPVVNFLRNNDFLCIIRAHEVKQEGYEEHRYNREPTDHPVLITVFSAPNYCDTVGNLGAIMQLNKNGYEFHQFSWQDHPYVLDLQFHNAFDFSIPMLAEYSAEIVTKFIEWLLDDKHDGDSNDANTEEYICK
eukprot:TRINITY_DN472_c0_g1_i3.p1 TRINITY_DN472_c0_g1~~TRINITY_DN472_c0_g1_i3.p1  ORF type:complete len:217 (-),score=40.73 TRINITY_DN472_c0_g1_i3:103-753(-)